MSFSKSYIYKLSISASLNSQAYSHIDVAPHAAPLFFAIGMHCLGCPSSRGETVEEACMVHGIDCDSFLAQLNHFLEAYEASEAEKKA